VRYDVSDKTYLLQPRWYRHPVAVEELTALMVAYKAEHSQSKASDGADCLARPVLVAMPSAAEP